MLSRASFLKGALVMGFGQSKTQGFNNPVLANFAAGPVIINKNGFFLYNGTPGPNNLFISENNSLSATDKFGNWVPAGLTIYGEPTPFGPGVGTATSVGFNGITSYLTNNAGVNSQQGGWTQVSTLALEAANVIVSVPVVARLPGGTSLQPEVWHNVAASSGFTVNTVQRYKLLENNSVRVQFSLASTNVAGTYTLFTLPAGYIPANQYDSVAVGVFNTDAAYTAGLLNTRFRVTTGGAVQIVTLAGTAINNVSGCFDIPLD